jgi:hypothetical protein
MPALPFIHIRSEKFPILPGEKEEIVNEGTYGKALAEYLEERLKRLGYEVPFTCVEDWGWWVEIKGQPFALGCCVYGASDATDSTDLCVKVSRDPERKWSFFKFRMIDTAPRVEGLFSDLKTIFAEDHDVEILGYPSEFPLSD